MLEHMNYFMEDFMKKNYLHIPSQRSCHKTSFFGQDYLVFDDLNEMKAMTKSGIYSEQTIEELL